VNRVWVVDDKIPVDVLQREGPFPSRFESEVVRHLVEHAAEGEWEEPTVRELCRELCEGDFTATFFLSPEQMLRALDQGATPPHAVIFDWEYPGSSDEKNLEALDRLLRGAFVYVQIYTHLGHDAVEPKIKDLRGRYPGRLLPAKGKGDVTPARLRTDILEAWSGTIAGEIADRVRSETFAAVERTLIDIGSVPRSVLAEMTERTSENLLQLVLAKVRDEIGEAGFEAFENVFSGSESADSSEAVQRLLSVWYYYFPADDRVRRGDLIDLGDGNLGFVVTPPCDLVRFPKKTGRRLTWLLTVRMDADGITALKAAGVKLDGIGGSIIAVHGHAGDTVILLPNVPLQHGSRDGFADYVVLCHGWNNQLFETAPGGSLLYEKVAPFSRRCTLADPYASGVIAKIMSVISSPGTPDLPKSERDRLTAILAAAGPLAPATSGPSTKIAPSADDVPATQNEAPGTSSAPAKVPDAAPIVSDPLDQENN
jgi:hypothetical protein